MVRSCIGRNLALLTTVAALTMASSVYADWGSWGSYGGSSGGYGSYGAYASYGSYGGGSWGGSHGGWGSHGGGLFARWHARHAARVQARLVRHASHGSWGGSTGYASCGSWGSSYVSYASYGGSYGSSGGSYGGYASWGGTVTGYGSGEVIEGQPIDGPPPTPGPADGSAPPPPPSVEEGGSVQLRNQPTLLTVEVPAGATLMVNGHETRSQGPVRQFTSRALQPGRTYPYRLEAEWDQDGQTVSEAKTVFLRSGGQHRVVFGDGTAAAESRTRLTLNVPEDAKVELAGTTTRSVGPVRTFTTTKLEPGQVWEDYTIKVTVERDGQTFTQQRVLDLVGGSEQELEFEFDQLQLAAAR